MSRLSDSIINDMQLFDSFRVEMFKEYLRHYDDKGDSWKDCDEFDLLQLLRESISSYSIISNPNHFIDIANFCLFLYYNVTWRNVELKKQTVNIDDLYKKEGS